MRLHAIARKSNSLKEKQTIYVHGLFYINNYINKSNNNYCNKISITECVKFSLVFVNLKKKFDFQFFFAVIVWLNFILKFLMPAPTKLMPHVPYKTEAKPRFWVYFRPEIKRNSIRPTARMLDALAYVIWMPRLRLGIYNTYARNSNFLA